jgi:hypothetical protein
MTYWSTATSNANDGVDISTKITASVRLKKAPEENGDEWDIELTYELPRLDLALDHLAAGKDPLRESFYADKATMARLTEKVPVLASFFCSLAVGGAALPANASVSGPKRL